MAMRDVLRSFHTGLTVACRLGGRPKVWGAPPARLSVGPTGVPSGMVKQGPPVKKMGGAVASHSAGGCASSGTCLPAQGIGSASGGSTRVSALRHRLNPPNGSSASWAGETGSSAVKARSYAQDLAAGQLRTKSPVATSTSTSNSASASFLASLGQTAQQNAAHLVGGAVRQSGVHSGALSAAVATPSRLPFLHSYWGAVPAGTAARAGFAAPRMSAALGAATWLPGSTLLMRITRSVLHFLGTGAAILAASQAAGAHMVVHAR